MEDKRISFLTEDYKQKIAYLTAHFTRMWTRFNIFVTIEMGLIGSKYLWQGAELNTPALFIAGVAFSLLWLLLGTEDRYLVYHYRKQIVQVGNALAKAYGLPTEQKGDKGFDFYQPVGWVDETKMVAWDKSVGIRFQAFSTTKMAAYVPLLVLAFWIGSWACYCPKAEVEKPVKVELIKPEK